MILPARTVSLRLRFRDLAGAAAFSSIAVSGSVPSWALALFLLCFVSSLFGIRPFSHRAGLGAAVLALLAIALFGDAFRGGVDLVVAACTFAALVAAQRMLSEPSPATDNQVHLTSL